MQVMLSEIQKAQGALSRLVNMSIPIKIAFKVSRLAKEVTEVWSLAEEQRKKLVEKLGEKDEQNGFTVKSENVQDFQKEYVMLLEEEVELQWKPISFNDLGEDLKITAVDVLSLEPFFTE